MSRHQIRRRQRIEDSRADISRLSQPPRRLSMSVIVAVLFGGVVQSLGWLFFLFGMVFVWVFGGSAEIPWMLRETGEIRTVNGTVVETFRTNATENERRVRGVRYLYFGNPNLDEPMSGTSYTTGSVPAVGHEVSVEYASARPELSRIVGMRSAKFSTGAWFVVIFPIIGLGLALTSLVLRLRLLPVLRDGCATYGTLLRKSATNTRINEQTVYRLEFGFELPDGKESLAQARSHQPQCLEDDAHEPLLYLELEPGRSVMFDAVPGHLTVDSHGQLGIGRPLLAWLGLVLPLAGTVACYLFVRELLGH